MKLFKIIVTVALYFFARLILPLLTSLDVMFINASQSKVLLLLIVVVIASLYVIFARVLLKHIDRLVKPLMVFSYGVFTINIGLYIANIVLYFVNDDMMRMLTVTRVLSFLASLAICGYFLYQLNETRKTLQEQK